MYSCMSHKRTWIIRIVPVKAFVLGKLHIFNRTWHLTFHCGYKIFVTLHGLFPWRHICLHNKFMLLIIFSSTCIQSGNFHYWHLNNLFNNNMRLLLSRLIFNFQNSIYSTLEVITQILKELNRDYSIKIYQPLSGDHSLAPSPFPPSPPAPSTPPTPAPLLPGFGGGTGALPPNCKAPKLICWLISCPPAFIICPPNWPPRDGTNFWRLSWMRHQ